MTISAAIIKTDIIMFVQTMLYVNNGTYSAWNTRTFDFSDSDHMDGFLTINNPKLSLTMGPFEVFSFAMVDEDKDGNFRACVNNVTFPTFNVMFDYVADFGINNEIPIYGSGSYKGRLTDISTTFCWLLASTADEILDFDINVDFRHQPSSLTGFYRNQELDPILGNILTTAKRLYAMWNNYEPQCSSKCVLNPVFLFATNSMLYDVDKSSAFSLDGCSCLYEIVRNLRSITGLEEKEEYTEYSIRNVYNMVNNLFEDIIFSGSLLHKLEEIL